MRILFLLSLAPILLPDPNGQWWHIPAVITTGFLGFGAYASGAIAGIIWMTRHEE